MDPQVLREAMTAYQAVYDEDLRETIEFENWVNALLDEGYDLSEYTWEDMYEAYLGEQGRGTRTGSNPNVFKPTPSAMGSRRGAAATPSGSSSGSVSTQRGRVTGSNTNNAFPQAARSGGTRRGAAAGTRGQGGRPLGSTTQRGGAPTPAPKPAPAPTARPAAPAPTAQARPATSAPTKPAPTATAKPANAMQTAASNLSGTGALAPAPKKPSLASQAAELRAMRQRSQQRQGLAQGFDMFDVVKGHLLDEGYADSEEAALAIMANMSEEWRQSIIEQNAIVTTGTSTNAAGKKIPWTHRVEPSGRRTVKDRFGERELREPKLKGA